MMLFIHYLHSHVLIQFGWYQILFISFLYCYFLFLVIDCMGFKSIYYKMKLIKKSNKWKPYMIDQIKLSIQIQG